MQSDETALINDFRTVLSKLNSLEKLDLVRGALKALETENEKYSEANKQEKSDFDENDDLTVCKAYGKIPKKYLNAKDYNCPHFDNENNGWYQLIKDKVERQQKKEK